MSLSCKALAWQDQVSGSISSTMKNGGRGRRFIKIYHSIHFDACILTYLKILI